MAAENANPDNWEWHPESMKRWKLTAEDDWQEFNTKWYGSCTPPSPSLSLGPQLSAIGNFPPEILVRECSGTIFDRIWAKAMTYGRMIGSIITGQPGTGKKALLFYLLARFLQLRQVVLFTLDGKDMYLFYHGVVYTIGLKSLDAIVPGEYRLPQPKSQTSEIFIWSLFDIEERHGPNRNLVHHPCLPVQTTSPDSIRFHIWYKQLRPMILGLPLWTRDELVKGLPYQRQYGSFMDALRKDPSQYESDPLQAFPGTRELLDEFQQDAGPVPPEAALDYLPGTAIDHFGHSAEVFDAVFDYSRIMEIYQEAFRLKLADLEDAIFTILLNYTRESSPSKCQGVLALSPVYSGAYSNDCWAVSFKSDWMARAIIQRIDVAERKSFGQRIVQRFPQVSAVARYFDPET